jgi:hypothetical protein
MSLIDSGHREFRRTATTFEELQHSMKPCDDFPVRMIPSMRIGDVTSDWMSLYEAAVRETDRSKLAERIATARGAILNNIEKSMRQPAFGDQCAMDNALRNLRRLARALDSSSLLMIRK